VRISLEALKLPETRGRRWIVEGAGGVLVPINERDLMRDLMRQTGFPVVIAARTALGTINHTLLTIAALRQANVPICGVAMIGEENTENRRAIERYGTVSVIGRLPILDKINRAALLEAYEKHFDHGAIE
jgi:dethiobiotin synthetase